MKVSKLKIVRMQNRFTQLELAQALGMNERRIMFFETGRREMTKEELYKIAKFLKVKPEDIEGWII